MTIYPCAHFCKVRKIVGGPGYQLLACLRNGLTTIAGFCFGNVWHMLGNEFTELAHDLGALGGWRGRPFWKSRFGSCHGLIGFKLTARGHLGQDFLRGRVNGFKGL